MSHDVFVSYSSKDKVIADSVIAALEQNGIRCWYAPRDIKPGEDWGRAISRAIEKSRVFLIIFSNYSNRSQRVLDEVNLAISNQAVILPFRIVNLEPDGAMRLHLSSRHWLDAYEPSWEVHIKSLVKSVSANLETTLEEQEIVLLVQETKKIGVQRSTPRLIITWLAISAIAIAAVWYGWRLWHKPEGTLRVEATAVAQISLPTHSSVPTSTEVPNEESTIYSTDDSAVLSLVERNGILDLVYESSELDLDPQNFGGPISDLTTALFCTLTNYDKENGIVIPEASESWSISTDGKYYTFNIRQDIPWVKHTLGGETSQILDEDGNGRFVNARDFEYAIKRMCSTDGYGLNFLFAPIIKGCEDVFNFEDPGNIPDELSANIGVRAVSDSELLIELTEPSAYFLTMTTLPTITAIPQWAVEKYGDAWKNPGTIVTSGYYVINNFKLGESIHLTYNELMPDDLSGEGNVGRINILLDQPYEDAYQLWTKGLIDVLTIPEEMVSNHQTKYPDEFHSVNYFRAQYFALNYQKSPFDNVHVRRAFAASLDKELFIKSMYDGNGLPTNHLGMPGMIGAPSFDEIGLDLNYNFAREELALGGYPNCKGLPKVNFYIRKASEFPVEILRSWEEALGCEPGTINSFYELQEDMNPSGIYIGWTADFPDMHNLMGNILHCEYSGRWFEFLKKDCGLIDDLIEEARQEININKRAVLYAQIEEASFGPQGEFPIIPVMMPVVNRAVHKWLDFNEKSTFIYQPTYYKWKVDMDMKQTFLAATETSK